MANQTQQRAQDRALVSAVLERRPGAFENLVETHQRLVWHLIQRVVPDPEDVRDLCQDVFFQVHRQLHRFRLESRLSTWIGRIAWHAALRHRERKRLPLIEPDADAPPPAERVADDFDLEAACADDQFLQHLHDAIARLTPLKRAVLTLYYLEDISVSEVAVITELPEGTVKSELFRARAQLRTALSPSLGDTP